MRFFFGLIAIVASIFPAIIFFVVIMTAIKTNNSMKDGKSTTNTHVSRDYTGITRAGKHMHKETVGTTRKDEGWEETVCGKYKDEIFGKDTCNKYIKPDYDSLTCEDEDLSGG